MSGINPRNIQWKKSKEIYFECHSIFMSEIGGKYTETSPLNDVHRQNFLVHTATMITTNNQLTRNCHGQF